MEERDLARPGLAGQCPGSRAPDTAGQSPDGAGSALRDLPNVPGPSPAPASAPPVQRPVVTPAQGTRVLPMASQGPVVASPHGTLLPPPPAPGSGAAQSRAAGPWHRYDPWGAPQALTVNAGAEGLESPRRPSRRGALLGGAVVLALVSGGIGGGIGAYLDRNGGLTRVELPQAPVEAGHRDSQSIAGIAAAALPGVVTLHVQGGGEQSTGTGFVLDNQGHILTNNHVVESATSGTTGDISVTFNSGEVAEAEVIGRDSGYDLAVVKVTGVFGLRPLTLGNSDSVRVGDPVVAIGAPYGLAGTVTSGIISAKERSITAGGDKGDGSDISYVDALQTDAPINPGNSGGPLVDSKGRVIGINSAIRAADSGPGIGSDGDQGGSIGLGFAIPINQGRRVAEELINTGRATHPVIGVTLDLDYSGDGARVRTRGGGSVSPVTPGGPGDKAGIRPGDVITEVDGARVHSGEGLIVKIRSHRPGDRLELSLERDGREHTLRLVLGSASDG
jgi:putative serine protease PepD